MSLLSTGSSQSQEAFTGLGTEVRVPRVNLLPPEILEGRRLRRRKAVLAGSLAVVIAGIGGSYVLASNAKADAGAELSAAQAEGTRLQAEQQKYAEVPRTIAAIDAAETARSVAMANDVEWFRTMTNLSLTLPSNVWFEDVEMRVNTDPGVPGSTGGTGAPVGPGAPAPIGSVEVSGSALDHPDVATWLDVLGRQPAITDAYFSTSQKKKTGTKTVVDFSSTAVVTDEALSHRYDRKQG